ncbi:hypothetical protein M1P56_24620 [Streptomyces sp. HU2014]|uniref:Uncharacterized protein n=1 Tax=Streptomyces albireticuli TaxID=1940 RepID=A0A1Z2L372_9ACTN|nr:MULTISPECIES: hypothetical protein [Streptomyces]ARZ68743.1 hypothetical protein SMD11_3099 [Streptomyces albireticuli]UQI47303.1 hypothetical protein M1P56_24620 [Streptomyces sp. HU2014]
MAVSLSAVVVLGIITVFLLRSRTVGTGAALVLFLFGFFTAGTGAAEPITRMCAALLHTIPSLTS